MKIKLQTGRSLSILTVIVTRVVLVAGFLLYAAIGLTQITPPVLTVAPAGTNALAITVTNGDGTSSYEIWTTPILGNTADYPWTVATVGTNSQTNFTVNIGDYYTGFYRAVVDTNAIPLWQAADPNNPAVGVLTVFIDTPTNGAVLQ